MVRASLFALGFVAVFTLLGLTASSLGSALNAYKPVLMAAGAVLVLVFGLKFLGVISIPFFDRVVKADDTRLTTRFGAVNALVMGVVFAAGWTPCVGPVLGSVLTYTASATSSPAAGAGYLAVYGLGFAVPLLITAAFAEAGIRLLDRIKPHLPRIERVIGALLVVVALSLGWDLVREIQASSGAKQNWAVTLTTAENGQRSPAMVELYSKDCAICDQMKPVVQSITRECHGKKVLVKAIDVSRSENASLTKKFRVVGVPTFIFLDRAGQEVARLVGKQTEGALRQALSALRGEACPGVGALPSGKDGKHAFPEQTKEQEVLSCRSTSTSASDVERSSRPSGPGTTGTAPSAPTARETDGECSAGSP
jgi:cytochrome c-type biogenesis protein